jgi:hypothetical protein
MSISKAYGLPDVPDLEDEFEYDPAKEGLSGAEKLAAPEVAGHLPELISMKLDTDGDDAHALMSDDGALAKEGDVVDAHNAHVGQMRHDRVDEAHVDDDHDAHVDDSHDAHVDDGHDDPVDGARNDRIEGAHDDRVDEGDHVRVGITHDVRIEDAHELCVEDVKNTHIDDAQDTVVNVTVVREGRVNESGKVSGPLSIVCAARFAPNSHHLP